MDELNIFRVMLLTALMVEEFSMRFAFARIEVRFARPSCDQNFSFESFASPRHCPKLQLWYSAVISLGSGDGDPGPCEHATCLTSSLCGLPTLFWQFALRHIPLTGPDTFGSLCSLFGLDNSDFMRKSSVGSTHWFLCVTEKRKV